MARGAEAATVAGVGSGAPVAAAAAPASRSQRPSATPAHRCQRRALVAVRAARGGWGPQGHETFIVRLPFGVGDGGAVSLPGQPRILAGLAAAAAQAWAAARRGRGSALRGAGEDQAYTSSIHIKHTSYWPLGHQLPGFGRGAPAKAAAWFTAAKQIAKAKQLC